MINLMRLEEILIPYKRDFVSKLWDKAKVKWEAVQCFKTHWDAEAPDFAGMLGRALGKTHNLLASMNHFPGKMIRNFAKGDITTHASITAKVFFEKREYKVVKEQKIERQGIFLTNFCMKKQMICD